MQVRYRGLGVSPGSAVGRAVWVDDRSSALPAEVRLEVTADVTASSEALTEHADAVAAELTTAARNASGPSQEILGALAAIARDPALVASAQQRITQQHMSAGRAVWEAGEELATKLSALGGDFAERARDVRDVRDRIVAQIEGRQIPGIPRLTSPAILVARELSTADTATLDAAMVRGIVTVEGGPSSHTAILARSLGIPAVVGVVEATEDLHDHGAVLVDGTEGVVLLDPTPDQLDTAERAAHPRAVSPFDGVGKTSDGHRVHLYANVASTDEALAARRGNAEGIGLLRTELIFPNESEPTEAAQAEVYYEIFAAFPGRRVVVRTLDAGADKPLAYVTNASEPNPALGVRGIRTAAAHPGVLDRQLRAIARAAATTEADVHVMAPMIATAAEARSFATRCEQHGLAQVGVMLEVPSAALLAERILPTVSFASVGTNDLTQYTMAADRTLGALAHLSGLLEPAVLKLIAQVCDSGAELSRPIGVCGEAAADPLAALVLVGLGVSSLSMTSRAIPQVAQALAQVTFVQCQELAEAAMGEEDAASAQRAVADLLAAGDSEGAT